MDKRNKIEFGINDDATYAPYEKSFDVKITTIDVVPVGNGGKKDERIFYEFKLQGITVQATGLCFKESIYFEEWEDKA